MKDVFKGKIISEFAIVDNEKVAKANELNKKLRHKEFFRVLSNKKVIRHNIKRIQSKCHKIGTYDVFKIALFFL